MSRNDTLVTGSVGSPVEPATMSQAECYQRLRAHLAFLRLPAAAEALPAVLDQARAQNLPLIAALERLLAIEVEATSPRRRESRRRLATCAPPTASTTSTSAPNRTSTPP